MKSINDHIVITGDLGIIQDSDANSVLSAVAYMKQTQTAWATDDPAHKKRIVVFAHGGLTDSTAAESYGSYSADFWLENKVYPFYFIWQSGAFDSFVDMIENEVRKRTSLPLALPQAMPSPGHLLVNMLTEEVVRDFPPVKNL